MDNGLRDLHEDVTNLENLRVLNARRNKLKNSGIPGGVFQLGDLTVVVRLILYLPLLKNEKG